jgi:hypothetical protein
MKLINTSIQRFRAIENLSLSFLDDLGRPRSATVFAGPNGSGKTSILFAIINALRGVTGYRTRDVPQPTQDDIRLPISYRAGWTTGKTEALVEVEIEFDDAEQEAIPELARIMGKERPPSLTDGRVTVCWRFPPGFDPDGNRRPWYSTDVFPGVPFVRSWLYARKWAIQAWTRKVPGMRPDLLRKIGGISFFPQDRNLRDRVIGENYGLASNGTPTPDSGDDSENEFERPAPREMTVSEILHYLSDYAKNRATPLPDDRNWEKRIQDLFHRVCAPKQYLGYLYREENPLGAPILQNGHAAYPISHAASGEQVILEYITRMTFPTPLDRSIILIDEPEIHLHPSWVRQFYLALPNIGEANQYLLTTHSAELRQRAIADKALVDLGELDQTQ